MSKLIEVAVDSGAMIKMHYSQPDVTLVTFTEEELIEFTRKMLEDAFNAGADEVSDEYTVPSVRDGRMYADEVLGK